MYRMILLCRSRRLQREIEEKEAQLLTIPGVMLNDSQDRVYPLGAAAGHLTGYVQAVTAEDLEKIWKIKDITQTV